MAPINSRVLNNIANDLGQEVAIPAADLQDIVVPVVGLERYRRRIRFFRLVAAVTAAQSTVKMTFESDKKVSRNVFLAEVVNGDTGGKVIVTAQVRLIELVSHIIEPLNAVVIEGEGQPVVGAMQTSMADDFRPRNIWVPRGADLIITIASQGATFSEAANMQLRMMVEEAPPEESLVGGAPTETVIA